MFIFLLLLFLQWIQPGTLKHATLTGTLKHTVEVCFQHAAFTWLVEICRCSQWKWPTAQSFWLIQVPMSHASLCLLAQKVFLAAKPKDYWCNLANFEYQGTRTIRKIPDHFPSLSLCHPVMLSHFSPALPRKNRSGGTNPINQSSQSQLNVNQSINQAKGLQWKSMLDWLILHIAGKIALGYNSRVNAKRDST